MERWREQFYLEHSGILGMKWGHRNGPPYPLGAGDHSAAEKKAGWRKSLKKNAVDKKRQKKDYKSYKKDLSKIEDAVKENVSDEDVKRLKAAYKKSQKNIYDFDKDYKNRKKADKAYDRDINSTMALRNIQDQIVRKSLGNYGNKKVKGRKKTYNDIGWEYVHWDEIMNKKIK
jgi:hypothetical protein